MPHRHNALLHGFSVPTHYSPLSGLIDDDQLNREEWLSERIRRLSLKLAGAGLRYLERQSIMAELEYYVAELEHLMAERGAGLSGPTLFSNYSGTNGNSR